MNLNTSSNSCDNSRKSSPNAYISSSMTRLEFCKAGCGCHTWVQGFRVLDFTGRVLTLSLKPASRAVDMNPTWRIMGLSQ